MDPAIREALRRLPHFRTIEEELLGRIAECARWREYRSGETVFSEGEPVRAFFAVAEGCVRVFRLGLDGHEQVLHHIRAGRSFAEAALLNMPSYPAHAVALETPTRLLEIGGAGFLPLFRREPRVAAAMVGSLSMWLLQLVERVEDLSVASSGARLARYLLRLPARGAGPRLVVQLPMSKKELAAHLAITPETLSRLLRKWNDQGLVVTDKGEITLLDANELTAIADREQDS